MGMVKVGPEQFRDLVEDYGDFLASILTEGESERVSELINRILELVKTEDPSECRCLHTALALTLHFFVSEALKLAKQIRAAKAAEELPVTLEYQETRQ